MKIADKFNIKFIKSKHSIQHLPVAVNKRFTTVHAILAAHQRMGKPIVALILGALLGARSLVEGVLGDEDLGGELVGNLDLRGDGPVPEPVDDAAVEQRRRGVLAVVEVRVRRVHREDDVEVPLHVLRELREVLVFVGRPQTLSPSAALAILDEVVPLVPLEQAWHLGLKRALAERASLNSGLRIRNPGSVSVRC